MVANGHRVDIDGQNSGNLCSSGVAFTIQRNYPNILESAGGEGQFVSQTEWLAFCNDIDEALSPIGQVKKNMIWFRLLGILLGMVILIFPIYKFNKDPVIALNARYPVLIIIFGITSMLIGPYIGLFSYLSKLRSAFRGMEGVCDRMSSQYEGIHFLAKRDEQFQRGFEGFDCGPSALKINYIWITTTDVINE